MLFTQKAKDKPQSRAQKFQPGSVLASCVSHLASPAPSSPALSSVATDVGGETTSSPLCSAPGHLTDAQQTALRSRAAQVWPPRRPCGTQGAACSCTTPSSAELTRPPFVPCVWKGGPRLPPPRGKYTAWPNELPSPRQGGLCCHDPRQGRGRGFPA